MANQKDEVMTDKEEIAITLRLHPELLDLVDQDAKEHFRKRTAHIREILREHCQPRQPDAHATA